MCPLNKFNFRLNTKSRKHDIFSSTGQFSFIENCACEFPPRHILVIMELLQTARCSAIMQVNRANICFNCLYIVTAKYCDYDEALSMGEVGVAIAMPCPAGFFCPKGTNFSTEHPCPPGTFGPSGELGKSTDCEDCTEGE